MQGLIIDFDTDGAQVAARTAHRALNEIVRHVPDEAGQLKSLLQAAANLSPRIVFTLGTADSVVDTSQPIEIPEVPPVDPEPAPSDGGAGAGGGGGGGGGAGGASTGGGTVTSPTSDVPPADTPLDGGTDTGTVPVAASQQPGLPALFSIPTLLLLVAVGLAALFGSYVRRLGLAALGGSASCPHGLTSGLPDLRRTT